MERGRPDSLIEWTRGHESLLRPVPRRQQLLADSVLLRWATSDSAAAQVALAVVALNAGYWRSSREGERVQRMYRVLYGEPGPLLYLLAQPPAFGTLDGRRASALSMIRWIDSDRAENAIFAYGCDAGWILLALAHDTAYMRSTAGTVDYFAAAPVLHRAACWVTPHHRHALDLSSSRRASRLSHAAAADYFLGGEWGRSGSSDVTLACFRGSGQSRFICPSNGHLKPAGCDRSGASAVANPFPGYVAGTAAQPVASRWRAPRIGHELGWHHAACTRGERG